MTTEYLERGEGQIAFEDSGGDGPLVVCVPGMGDLRGQYRFLMPQLVAAGYRVIIIDLRGHGESSVGWAEYTPAAVGGDMVALLRDLKAGPATLVGNSMAGASAVWAAAEAPQLVSGLVLIDPFVRDIPATFVQNLAIKLLFIGPWKVSSWLTYYSNLYPSRKPIDLAAYKAKLGANLREPGRFAAFRALMAAPKSDIEARCAQVKTPTLVVMGTKDPDFKDAEAEARWVAARLNGKVQMVDGAGHYPHAEMPEQVGPAIIEFIGAMAHVG